MAEYKGKGTLVKMDISSTYTTIGQIVGDIDFPDEMGTYETTNHDSTDRDREFIAGLKNRTLSFTLAWDPEDTEHVALRTAYEAGTKTGFQVVYTDDGNKTYQFDAVITGMGKQAPIDGLLGCSVSLQVSGAITEDPVVV